MDIDKAAKFHMSYICWALVLQEIKAKKFNDENCVKILQNLLKIYGLKQLLTDTSPLFEAGFFAAGQHRLLTQALDA